MIDRRAFLWSAVGAIRVAPLAVEARPAGKMARVGFLVMARNPGVESAFPRGLAQLDYVEGRNIIIEWRSADGRNDRMLAKAVELVELRADIIVAAGPEARIAAMKATSTIPIVAVGGSDPVGEGWAMSLARPGGNVTGLTVTYPELITKQLELLSQLIPRLSRVGILWDPEAIPLSMRAVQTASMQAAGRSLGISVEVIEVRRPTDLDGAVRRAIQGGQQALLVAETALVFAHRAAIAELARKNRLPTIGEWRQSAGAGFLVSYGADLSDLLRRAASYVDRIIKGAEPGTLPIERPTKFELVINARTAKALGLTIPQSLLLRADELIK